FRIWALYRAIGHLLFHLVLGDNYYGRARTVGNKVVSFISRPAIRHYLFNTLVKRFSDDWKPAAITGQGSVAQFDILQDDIISSAELDAFGYMYTIAEENSLTRKAPIGITKAVALYSYNQDMAFYANHDLVQRANQNGLNITPNPFQREEHTSLYKLSFTIDSKILGEDSFIVNNKPQYDEKGKTLIIEVKKPQSLILANVEKKVDENDESNIWYELNNKRIYIDGKEIKIEAEIGKKSKKKKSEKEILTIESALSDQGEKGEKSVEQKEDNKGKSDKKQNKPKIEIEEFEEIKEDEKKYYKFSVTREPQYDENTKALIIETGIVKTFNNIAPKNNSQDEYGIKNNNKVIGEIKVENISNNLFKVSVKLSDEIKKRRICQILTVIHDGLVAHSSGEDNTIVPLFLIAAPVKVPSPVFHPYIDIVIEEGKPKVIGIKDCINNSWVEEQNDQSKIKKVYIKDCERLSISKEEIKEKTFGSWKEFLSACGLENCECHPEENSERSDNSEASSSTTTPSEDTNGGGNR
ncbi:type I-B CRISPR-associated protein Cas7/Cst2/DevR, partial [Treponema sp. J25]|uniref:type I-B CRISPR-associated protein Cas7/Cst2/DevR n=1 Tax=Treponema sp. J25 TaxID=2094121 RepID=UPI0010444FD3